MFIVLLPRHSSVNYGLKGFKKEPRFGTVYRLSPFSKVGRFQLRIFIFNPYGVGDV
jgi:hypothetical protein